MMNSDTTNPQGDITRVWFDIFLTPDRQQQHDKIVKRPQEEQSVVLQDLLIYLYSLSTHETWGKPKKDFGWMVGLLRRAASQVLANMDRRAVDQLKAKVLEISAESDKNALDAKSEGEQILPYLRSVPDLWSSAQRWAMKDYPEYETFEPDHEFIDAMESLVDAWDAKTWRNAR